MRELLTLGLSAERLTDSTACCSVLEITRTGRKSMNGVKYRCAYIFTEMVID